MCGITGGAWTSEGAPLELETIRRMADVLRHRGPDDAGEYRTDVFSHTYAGAIVGVGLGFRRLSYIDLPGGHQPMPNEDNSIWVVFNGEIYNFQTLRRRLEGAGHKFRTESDTEVLVHLYEDEGPAFVERLEGQFAFALWDERKRQLMLARDRLGKKPLIYRLESGRLLFASEIKSILQVPGVPREIDPHALDEYLMYQYVPHPNTIFKGIRKLPPAHYALYRDDHFSTHCYWNPDFSRVSDRSHEETVAELRARLTAAVEKRLIADVPLGAFLSGGVDSSIIVGIMQRLKQERVKTFSIGFPVREYDETSYARMVAEKLGTDHHEFIVEPNAIEILPKLAWYYDEPFADSSAIPTYYVSKFTREHVKGALTGDGGDELFAGYPRYRAVRIGAMFDRLPPMLRRALAGRKWSRLPASPRQKSVVRRFKRLVGALNETPVERYANWISIFNDERRAQLYTDEFRAQIADSRPIGFLAAAFERGRKRDPVTQASLADLITYLPCDLNHKVDIASMANSLECRQPFLDHHVVELAIETPISMKLRGRQDKRILRDAFGDLLPPAVQKRKKMGFGVPLDHWFRHELRDVTRDVLLDPSTLALGYFRPEYVTQLVEDHQEGRFDHSYRLWSLLFFEVWRRGWMEKSE